MLSLFNLIYIFIILPRRMQRVARQKQRGTIEWIAFAVVACILAEMLFTNIFVLCLAVFSNNSIKENLENWVIVQLMRVLILFIGISIGEAIKVYLRTLPTKEPVLIIE